MYLLVRCPFCKTLTGARFSKCGWRGSKLSCDIEGCKEHGTIVVNDHGVDTSLCDKHYREWCDSESKMAIELFGLKL